jgi:hypothetical protein
MSILEAARLKSFSEEIHAATSSDLVGHTTDELELRCEQFRQLNSSAGQFIEHANELPAENTINLASVFEGVRDDVATAYERWRPVSIGKASSEHRGKIGKVHAHLMNEVASLHEKINTLYWIIREQEADRDKTLPGEFSNPDDLFTAMGV